MWPLPPLLPRDGCTLTTRVDPPLRQAALCAKGKGILAADESTGTIGKRFLPIGVENNEENRRAYRELLFTTEGVRGASLTARPSSSVGGACAPRSSQRPLCRAGLGQWISGVIMYEETLTQKAADGTPFVEVLRRHGIITGIKA